MYPPEPTDAGTATRLDDLQRQIERLSGIGAWQLDVATGALLWTEQTYRLHDVDPATFRPSLAAARAFLSPAARGEFDAALRAAIDDAQPWDLELELTTPRGTRRWVRARGEAQRHDGRCIRIVGTLQDITAQRAEREALAAQTADALQSALARLKLATEAAGIGIWERDLVTGEGSWDDTLLGLYGLQRGDRMPSRELAVQMVHPDDRAGVLAAWRRIQEVDHAVEFEYRVVRPDGRVVYLNTRGLAERDEEGRPYRVVGATIDVTAKQTAQRQLREYIEWLRLAGEATGIGFFQVAVDGSFRRHDRQLRTMFGLDPDAPAIGDSEFEATVLEEDLPLIHAARRRALQTDQPIEAEYRVRMPSGALRHIFTRRVRRCDDQGRPLYVIGTAVDVTDNRRAQQALQAAHDRLRLATQTAKIGIWQRDLGSGALTWDAPMRELYRVEPDWQPTPQRWLERVHPDDRARLARRFGRSEENVDEGRDEYRIVLPDGSVRHVVENFTVRRDDFGIALQVLGTNLDITDVRSAQQERDALYERMQLTAESIGLGVWDWDLVAGSSAWNDQMYALFGRTRGDFVDHVWSDFLHAEDVALARAELARAIEATGRCDFEFRVALPDGRLRWIACRGRVQRDPSGTPVRMIGVNWDVTEKHVAEAALRDKETAERASRAKSEFLSRMSHELRTPMNAILGFAQVLELDRRNPLTSVQADRVARIQKAGWHLLTLINEVLELSRIEAGALTLALAPVPLAGSVHESIELIASNAAERGIAVELQLRADTPALVRADATRLKQVLLNVLSNAVKYNRDGGRVDVLIGRVGAEATVRVRDTGAGMSEAQLAQLFQPFNRLGVGDAIEGTGIGLTITRRLLELMGGQIDVTSRVGHGTEVTVRLLIEEEAAAPAPAIAAADAVTDGNAAAATVLYVEDNAPNRELVREILSLRPGIRLLEAATGEEGLRLATSTPLDFALIDMRLPDMDGIELLQRLRDTDAADLPCIVLSANALAADRERALAAGFRDYWTKPIVALDFLRAIDQTLERLPAGARI